jgi:ABC-type sugar transport system ATPase subunit
VAANIFLGHETAPKGLLRHRKERETATRLLKRLGATIDPDALVQNLSLAHQQLVEIARALAREARMLVMDEPTAALAPREVTHLFDVLRELSGRGMGIIFISHRLDEVMDISHRITVMRDGVTVATRPASEFTRRQLIEQMVGRTIETEYPKEAVAIGEVCVEVNGLSGGKIRNVSFAVRSGEVLGLAGLMGAGRTELARLIFGADPKDGGELRLGGRRLSIASPRDAIRGGICLLTEDRKLHGLVLKASARENFALPNLRAWSRGGWLDRNREQQRFQARVTELGISLSGAEQRAEELSGGNQQKLLVARWLESNSQVIIFDEPTRGIDVGAKYEIYLLIGQLARQGKAVLVISSELPELLGICDRILVMRRGEMSGEITDVRRATQESVMAMAV